MTGPQVNYYYDCGFDFIEIPAICFKQFYYLSIVSIGIIARTTPVGGMRIGMPDPSRLLHSTPWKINKKCGFVSSPYIGKSCSSHVQELQPFHSQTLTGDKLFWPSYTKSMGFFCALHILSPFLFLHLQPPALRFSDSMCVASNGYKKLVAPPPRAAPVKTSNSLLPSNGFRWKSTRSQA